MLYKYIVRLRLIAAYGLLLALGACNTVDEGQGYSATSTSGDIVWHDLITYDLKTARRFYGGLFGWEFDEVAPRDGNPYVLAKKDGKYTGGIIEIPPPTDGNDYSRWLGYMLVDDINAALARTPANGGQVLTEVQDRGSTGKIAAISDSQAAVLGLIESRLESQDQLLRDAHGAIVWNELLANDDQSAARFYTALTGAQVNTLSRRGGEYLMLESGGTQHAGIMQIPLGDTDPLWLSYFAVVDPGALVSVVEALGGKVIIAPSADIREGSMALIQDPAGAVLALQKWPL